MTVSLHVLLTFEANISSIDIIIVYRSLGMPHVSMGNLELDSISQSAAGFVNQKYVSM